MTIEAFEALHQAAQKALSEKSFDQAEALFMKLHTSYPHRPHGLIGQAQIAQHREMWTIATTLWDECLQSYPNGSRDDWLRSKAWSLAHLGRGIEAEALVQPLVASSPGDPRPLVTLAGIMMADKRWNRAVQLWDELLQRFPARKEVGWLVARADALDRLGETEQAQNAFLEIAREQPDHPHAAARYLQLLGRTDPPDDALAAIKFGLFRGHTEYNLTLIGAQFALRCDDMEHIRQVLPLLLSEVSNAAQCAAVFQLIPPVLHGRERYNSWLQLEQKVQFLARGWQRTDIAGLHTVNARLKLAFRDYSGFVALLDRVGTEIETPWSKRFSRIARILRAEKFPNHDAEKVFGIGLSKSGTTSLAHALGQLGYLTAHYQNDFTFELLTTEDAFLFDALTDTTVCPDFESLFHMFPNSKFVYTTRPMDSWLASYERHDRQFMRSTDFQVLRKRVTTPGLTRYGTDLARSAVSVFYRYSDPMAARLAFEARLTGFFTGPRAARLLVFDVFSGQGWRELCSFLGRPIPDTLFPWNNRAS